MRITIRIEAIASYETDVEVETVEEAATKARELANTLPDSAFTIDDAQVVLYDAQGNPVEME